VTTQLDLFAPREAPPVPLASNRSRALDDLTADELRARIIEAVEEPAEDEPASWWHPKPLGFTLARSFADLFESHAPDTSARPDDIELPETECVVSPLCTITGNGDFRYMWARPSAAVLEYLGRSIVVPDRLDFEIVVRSPDEALVVARHNRIIGSRWLALIDPRTIPTEQPSLADKPDRSPRVRRAVPAPKNTPEPTSILTERQRELLRVVACAGNVARFGSEERIPDWKALKVVLETLGGKWARKPQAFVFPDGTDVAAIVETAIETGEILDPKAAGYFPTPRHIAERVVAAARIQPGDVWLEPNAGQGAIADVAWERHPDAFPKLVELLDANRKALRAKPYWPVLAEPRDFLSIAPGSLGQVDCVIMNPPFARGADVDHVAHALEFLPVGGRLASVMSAGVSFRQDAKTTAFRALVERHGGVIEDLPAGSFLESGTGVSTVLVSMTKRAA